MPIGDYCRRDVTATDPQATLRAAARRMAENGIGALPVLSHDKVVGVVTDRDVALAALCEGGDADRNVVGDLIHGTAPTCVHEASPLGVAAGMLRRHSIRRLPVVDADERLVGILTSDDVLRLVTGELEGLARAVATQSPGAPDEPAPSTADLLLEEEE